MNKQVILVIIKVNSEPNAAPVVFLINCPLGNNRGVLMKYCSMHCQPALLLLCFSFCLSGHLSITSIVAPNTHF